METPLKELSTKERIIDAAGNIFGQMGFKSATIRDIAKTADVNVASVNYHFRDKDGLYRTVLEDIFLKGFKRFPSVPPLAPGQDPNKALYDFVYNMFYRFLSREGWGGYKGKGRLIAREFLDPSPAFGDILETYLKPHRNALLTIIAALAGREPDDSRLLPCAVSILGQCVYYAFATPVIGRMAPACAPTEDNLDKLAEYVYQFSLGGIRQLAGTAADQPPETESGQKENTP